MNYYIDVQLKPDAEMRENVLLNKVYTKLHKALVSMCSTDIGVSFPCYRIKLGDVIRIHGSKENLSDLQASQWIGGLSGYCDVASISTIPEGAMHRMVFRKQANKTAAKLRRLIKRDSIPNEKIKPYKAQMYAESLDNPYLELESSSNGFKHRRFIAFGELGGEAITGSFDQFGLSKSATIPWF